MKPQCDLSLVEMDGKKYFGLFSLLLACIVLATSNLNGVEIATGNLNVTIQMDLLGMPLENATTESRIAYYFQRCIFTTLTTD